MINKKPRTYNEIIRLKRCYTLANYYTNITENIFNEMYEVLSLSEKNSIRATQRILSFIDENKKIVKTYSLNPKDSTFDKIDIDNDNFYITLHYDTRSSSSWGGSSGNNNNNKIKKFLKMLKL